MHRWEAGGIAGTAAAIALPAALFGLAHLGGGLLMAVLATIVGLGSGWAFARTGCIAAAVFTHFAVNAVHLLAFTYPARVA
jgi:membrane protease YdiL (CAAX protease family)